jgi:tetratricopeptide (TPR) repeat protein
MLLLLAGLISLVAPLTAEILKDAGLSASSSVNGKTEKEGRTDDGPADTGLPEDLAKLLKEAEQRPAERAVVDGRQPLSAAARFASMIAGDPDAAARHQFRCVVAMTKSGSPEEALKLAQTIPDYRSTLAQLVCAEAMLARGIGKAEVEEILDSAARRLPEAKPWQQDLIRAKLASTGAQVGWDEDKTNALLAPIVLDSDRFGARTLVMVVRMIRDGKFDSARFEEHMKARPAAEVPVPDMLEAARLLMELLHKKESDGALVEDAIRHLLRESQAFHADVLLELAHFWLLRGDEAKAKAMFEKAEPQFGFHLESGGALYLSMAKLWKARGKQEQIRPYFSKVEEKARDLGEAARIGALAHMAAAWAQLGDLERCDRLMLEALQVAAEHPNPRVRMMGCVDLCLVHDAEKMTLSPEIAEGLAAIMRGDKPSAEAN